MSEKQAPQLSVAERMYPHLRKQPPQEASPPELSAQPDAAGEADGAVYLSPGGLWPAAGAVSPRLSLDQLIAEAEEGEVKP